MTGDALREVFTYDLAAFPFPTLVSRALGCDALDRLHERHPRPTDATGDQDTPVHEMFYREYPQMRDTYERFLRDVVAARYREDICVQRVPTFRVHYPEATAVREFHRDSDYNHQSGIMNYWLTLTPAYGTNSIWIETQPDSGDFRPVDLVPGQVLRFNAVRLTHGNHSNDTAATRVSFDFRVLPLEEYRETGLTSVRSGRRLGLDDYYMLLTRDGELRHVVGTAY
jgi:hypothetical protein